MKVNVDLPKNGYDIVIENGAIQKVGTWLSQLWKAQKVAVITDNHVGSLYAGQVVKSHSQKSKRVLSSSANKKMTNMMLGTFTNGTGVNAAPYGYTMAGKTGTTETDFNPDLSGDQWVIGYTPDVVISQWLGFPKTDETHYLTGTSAETASVIFRNVANSVLPYTEGTSFDNEKNSYQENGIAPVGQETETESPEEDKGFFDTVKERAAGIVDDAKKAIDEADIPGKAQNAWDTFKGWFGF